jgi:hypothetical protein
LSELWNHKREGIKKRKLPGNFLNGSNSL